MYANMNMLVCLHELLIICKYIINRLELVVICLKDNVMMKGMGWIIYTLYFIICIIHIYVYKYMYIYMKILIYLQTGISRHLFERWCDDERNGVVLAGYTVEGTLAHDLLNNPTGIHIYTYICICTYICM
jgi:hypothetical protein